jgi:hypothetical protein
LVLEALHHVVTLGKLVIDLSRKGTFVLKAFPLDVAVKSIELMDKGVELFLLLLEGVLAREVTRLALVVLLVGGSSCNTPGVTQGVHPELPHLTYYHMWVSLSKVHQT